MNKGRGKNLEEGTERGRRISVSSLSYSQWNFTNVLSFDDLLFYVFSVIRNWNFVLFCFCLIPHVRLIKIRKNCPNPYFPNTRFPNLCLRRGYITHWVEKTQTFSATWQMHITLKNPVTIRLENCFEKYCTPLDKLFFRSSNYWCTQTWITTSDS